MAELSPMEPEKASVRYPVKKIPKTWKNKQVGVTWFVQDVVLNSRMGIVRCAM